MRTCTSCGLEQDHLFSFCKRCGAHLPDSTPTPALAPPPVSSVDPHSASSPIPPCPACGSPWPDSWAFCDACGYSRAASAPPTRPSHRLVAGLSIWLVLLLSAAALVWYYFSFRLTLSPIASGSTVFLDGEPVQRLAQSAGSVTLGPLSRTRHILAVESPNHLPWTRDFWPERFALSHSIEVRQLPEVGCVTFSYSGWVEVSLGAQVAPGVFCAPVGTVASAKSSTSGVAIRFTYTRDDQSISLTKGALSPDPPLSSASSAPETTQPAAIQSAALQPDPARARQLVREAESHFEAARYQDALALCNAALRANPGDSSARALASRISKTMQILGAK